MQYEKGESARVRPFCGYVGSKRHRAVCAISEETRVYAHLSYLQ